MNELEHGIYYEDSFLGVTLGALVFTHGTIMIDAPLRMEDDRSWRSTLFNLRGGSNRLLVNLDAHPDRTLGAKNWDCPVVAHHKTAQVFRSRPTIFKGQSLPTGSAWELFGEAIGMRWTIPDITFTERMSLHWGGPEVILEHHPGPTAGSIWVIVPAEKVIFIGDAIAADQPPFLANAELSQWIEQLEHLKKSCSNYLIVAGRGGLVPKKGIQGQIHTLKSVQRGIDKLVKRNAGPEATEALIPSLLSEFSASPEMQETYTYRLRYGLFQYYASHYRPSSSLEKPYIVDDEQ